MALSGKIVRDIILCCSAVLSHISPVGNPGLSDFQFFGHLQKHLAGKHFVTDSTLHEASCPLQAADS